MLHGERVSSRSRNDSVGTLFHHQASRRRRLPDLGQGNRTAMFCGRAHHQRIKRNTPAGVWKAAVPHRIHLWIGFDGVRHVHRGVQWVGTGAQPRKSGLVFGARERPGAQQE